MGTALASIYEKLLKNDNNFEKEPSYINFVIDEQSYISSSNMLKMKLSGKNI